MASTTPFARPTTRRDFLATTSVAVVGTVLGARVLRADIPVALPSNSPYTSDAFLTERASGSDLRALAAHALEAAQKAGATYADIRIAERHQLEAQLEQVSLQAQLTYGIRTLVNGAWGFAYGRVPTPEQVARCAQEAADSGKIASQISETSAGDRGAWIPAPVVTGEWRTPVRIDPFTVPIQQHAEIQDAMRMDMQRVPGGGLSYLILQWIRETRVVAATTGTLVTQQLYRALPRFDVTGRTGRFEVEKVVRVDRWSSAGYEAILDPEMMDQLKAAAEEGVRLSRFPLRVLDVGRYPIVMDGSSMGALVGQFLGPSLEMDRVLGSEIEASGTSKLSLDCVGTPVISPLLTVYGHRTFPSVSAVQWDDEGNVPREHTVIKDGVLTDYHTSGQTVSALKSWYAQRNEPVRSNGCAVAPMAENAILVRTPHLVIQPGQSRMSLDDLCRDMRRGVLLLTNERISADQQLSSGSISPWNCLFEVSQGRIVSRLIAAGLQFNTFPLLKNMAGVGDASTMQLQNVRTSKGMPWVRSFSAATAPAALFKEINVVSSRY